MLSKVNFTRLGNLDKSSEYLKDCLVLYKFVLNDLTFLPKLKKLKYVSKIHLQVCALLSQTNNHEEAHYHAKLAAHYSQQIIKELLIIAMANSNENRRILFEKPQNTNFAFVGGIPSLIASKLIPLLQELETKFVNDYVDKILNDNYIADSKAKQNKSSINEINNLNNKNLEFRNLFGYLPHEEWINLNIGSIMQISPLTWSDLLSYIPYNLELSRELVLEAIAMLSVSYFSISTEKRFLAEVKSLENETYKKSEFFHAKSLEIACCFLPFETPLYLHILMSYQKHHAPSNQQPPVEKEPKLDKNDTKESHEKNDKIDKAEKNEKNERNDKKEKNEKNDFEIIKPYSGNYPTNNPAVVRSHAKIRFCLSPLPKEFNNEYNVSNLITVAGPEFYHTEANFNADFNSIDENKKNENQANTLSEDEKCSTPEPFNIFKRKMKTEKNSNNVIGLIQKNPNQKDRDIPRPKTSQKIKKRIGKGKTDMNEINKFCNEAYRKIGTESNSKTSINEKSPGQTFYLKNKNGSAQKASVHKAIKIKPSDNPKGSNAQPNIYNLRVFDEIIENQRQNQSIFK